MKILRARLTSSEREPAMAEARRPARREIGTGERSEKIRT